MIRRQRDNGHFRELLRSSDALLIILSGVFIVVGLLFEHVLDLFPQWRVVFPLAALSLTACPILIGAVRGLIKLKVNVDELVSIAIVSTLILGEFNSAAIVAFIMALGGLIEEFTSELSRKAVEAMICAQPELACVLKDGTEIEARVEDVQVGETIRIRPGDIVPLDGEVIQGSTTVDESNLTGESLPICREEGDGVFAGSRNFDGCVDVEVTCASCDSTVVKIADLIRDAEKHRAPIIRVAERYAQWFTPAILLIAGVTWLATGDPMRAVTILIVGCPCAFVLATPTAVVAALGRAAKQGVLVKGGKFIEVAGQVDVLAFDKTGTLTEARPQVVDVKNFNGYTPADILGLAASIEAGTEHPLANAILSEAKSRGIPFTPTIERFKAVAGMGVLVGESLVGSPRFFEMKGISLGESTNAYIQSCEAKGRSVLLVGKEMEVIGGIAVQDSLRPEAPNVVRWATDLGLDVVLLTGDRAEPAREVTSSLNLSEVHASMLPHDKQMYIRRLQNEGRSVCFIGDGTNDGPALAEAKIGISLASRRNNIALETADAVLMRDGLQHLPFLIHLGRRTAKIINQNLLFFGLGFNASMLALSAFGVFTPVLGALAHNAGSVLVVLNSARLLWTRPCNPLKITS